MELLATETETYKPLLTAHPPLPLALKLSGLPLAIPLPHSKVGSQACSVHNGIAGCEKFKYLCLNQPAYALRIYKTA